KMKDIMKMKMKVVFALALNLLSVLASAQKADNGNDNAILTKLPPIVSTRISGAPTLAQPQLIIGVDKPVVGGGFGSASPAMLDWDGDGLKDLIVGEFGSGVESSSGMIMGNFLRVYKNEGTEEAPGFSGRFEYARAPFEILTNGTPY